MNRCYHLRSIGWAAMTLLLTGCQDSSDTAANKPTGTTELAASQPAASCQLGQVADLPVEMSPDSDTLVPVWINGKQTKMILSTEAWPTYLFEDGARSLGLKVSNSYWIRYSQNNGDDGQATLADFKVGSLETHNLTLVVLLNVNNTKALTNWQSVIKGSGAVGTLPASFLYAYDVEFDLKAKHIRLFSQKHCPGNVVYWPGPVIEVPFSYQNSIEGFPVEFGGPLIQFNISIAGHAGNAVLVSNGDRIGMTWATANSFGIYRDTPGVTKTSQTSFYRDQAYPVYDYVVPAMVIGDETIYNVPVKILDTYGARTFLAIGESFLEANRVYIAYGENKLYITPYHYKYKDAADAQ